MSAYNRKRAGALLQAKRNALGYTQEQLAELVGCSWGTIAAIEGGTAGTSIDTLLTLCRLLHTTPNEVLLEADFDEAAWLADRLAHLSPEQRSTAIAILAPFIDSVLK